MRAETQWELLPLSEVRTCANMLFLQEAVDPAEFGAGGSVSCLLDH